ncbi:hypothetical protein F5X96DRAFT_670910 [Biscogniauxia mediterranea]|nr:hypothetical protein F5X96DRAFT_670910 [Biscogniauxia mediterranea]
MSSENKGPASTSDFEVDPRLEQLRRIHLIDNVRVSFTSLALLCGLAVLGTSGDTLAVYNATHVSNNFHLPLWPDQFDLRPTIALVVGGVVVVFANAVSLLFSKVQVLRGQALIHTPLTFLAPFVGFVAVMVSMIFFYAVNASISVDTVQSWSCRWGYTSMDRRPYFGTLCKESQTALYLSVVLVPIELIIFTTAGYQVTMERRASKLLPTIHKSSSPALS